MLHARSVTALGASFSAGPGLAPYADARAGRSRASLGALVARRLDCPLRDAAVSGATTADVLTTAQRIAGRRYPPQIESVRADADVVTICVGGNDLGHVGTAMTFAAAGRLDAWHLAPLARRLRARVVPLPSRPVDVVATTLGRIVTAVRERAPQARIVLVDYLPLVSVADAGAVPVTRAEAERIVATASLLTTAFTRVAAAHATRLARAADVGRAHHLGAAEPWIQPLTMIGRPDRVAGSLHPTAIGMQKVADAVVDALSGCATV